MEFHYLDGWPECQGEKGFEQCMEHAPGCAVRRIPTGGYITRQILIPADDSIEIE
jgi:hypothetical protein